MNDFRDYIQHYGILGMHWGIRRYQNPDGTLTEAGRKRYQKQLYTDLKRANKENPRKPNQFSSKEYRDKANEIVKSHMTNEQLKRLKTAKNAFINTKDPYDIFESTKEYDTAVKQAYKDTYDFFKKNAPTELSDWEKQTKDLTAIHDFRKVFEGYEDDALQRGFDEFLVDPKNKKADDDYNKAAQAYTDTVKDITKEIVGSYGNKPIEYNNYVNVWRTVQSEVEDRLYFMSTDDLEKFK